MGILKDWLEYLDAQVGHGVYLWGGQGKHVSEVADVRSYIDSKAQDGERAARVWKYYQTVSKTESDLRFFDCSGLAMYFFQNLHGITKSDTTAHGLWGGCTALKKSELRPGDFVFKKSGGKMTHIGYVAQNGRIIEARASGYGVVKRDLSAGSWTHYGRHKWLKAEIEGGTAATVSKVETIAKPAAKPATKAPEAVRPTLRKGSKGEAVKTMQRALMKLGIGLPRYGADGDFGNETLAAVMAFQVASKLTVDGICGPKTWAALDAAGKE